MRRGIGSVGGFAGVLVALAAVGGCGSSGSGSADPAALAPASAPLYASVLVKPAGGSSAAAVVAAKKLTHLAEPYGSLAQALLASPGASLTYKSEIAPWVGERAGVFVTALQPSKLAAAAGSLQSLLQGGTTALSSLLSAQALTAHGTQGAIVLQTSDTGAAQSFVAKQAGRQGAHATSYRGVTFQLAPGGLAEGLIKDFVVIGSESGMRAAIDTSLGGASFAGSAGYAKPTSETVASAYVKPEALAAGATGTAGTTGATGAAGAKGTTGTTGATGAIAPGEGGKAGGGASSLVGQLLAGVQSATLTATATDQSLSLQGEIHSSGMGKPLFGAEGAQALGELPATSWLAAGVGDTGANLPRALALLQGVASLGSSTVFSTFGGPSIEKVFQTLAAHGSEVEGAFASWAGPGGMFVSGTGLFNLQAALVIASKDPVASRAAVGRLASLFKSAGATVASASVPGTDAAQSVKLQGFPAVIFIADGGGKFVLGLGQQSIEGATSPSATLSTSAAYSTAASTLGSGIEPSLIVEFPTLFGFLEGIGLTQSPSVSGLVPYLKSLGTLTAGASGSGGTQRYKAVLGLV